MLAPVLFVASIPGYISSILEVVRADLKVGTVEAPVVLVIALDLLGVLASVTAASMCLTLAVVFVSSYLLLYGTIMAGPLEWVEDCYPAWPTLSVEVIQPLFLTTPTVALVVLFPNGTFVPRWTRWLTVASVALVAAMLYLPEVYWDLLMVVILLGAFYAQVYRYRRVSSSTERQQTKWVTFGFLLWWLMVLMHRRFYRRKYDARKTLEDFSARLRDETDLDSLRMRS